MTILSRRSAGLLVPLFSVRTGAEWGIGEFPDLVPMAEWARSAGASVLLTLPLLEPSPGQDSPYSSCSFFAIDPIHIRCAEVEGAAPDPDERRRLERVVESPLVRKDEVRRIKESVLRRAFARFDPDSEPGRDRARFAEEHAHWLEDYAIFRTLKTVWPESWRTWPVALRRAETDAVLEIRRLHAREIAFRSWLQWVAFRQLEAAKQKLTALGVALGGDEPFLVADDSADVWAGQERFRFDATVGAPPDAFSAEGQEWGLPPYRWERIAAEGYALFRQRGRHAARIYDLVRIDHVVGLYRTYHRPLDKSAPFFWPEGELRQQVQGEAVLRAFAEGGAELLAEDLGVIPDFVRRSLASLGVPGYRVLRWEKDDAGRFRDPRAWPELSVATTGTHDTESSMQWWDALPEAERTAARALDELGRVPLERSRHYGEELRAALLAEVYGSASRLALLPIQDALMLRDRINVPNTMGPENWSWRMPWTVSAMSEDAIVRGRARALHDLAQATGRLR